jgi:hypothetical protein
MMMMMMMMMTGKAVNEYKTARGQKPSCNNNRWDMTQTSTGTISRVLFPNDTQKPTNQKHFKTPQLDIAVIFNARLLGPVGGIGHA